MNQLSISNFPPLDYASNEAINTLCTNLSYCGKEIRSVLITSRYMHEGKSSIAMNALRTLASFGKQVVLVDTDLRRSPLARRYRFRYSTPNVNGLAQYLAGMCTLEDALYMTDIPNAFIVPAGREVLNSLQLLTSPRYAEMMQMLNQYFDVVLVDSPPAGVIVDAIEVARHCDGALIVVSYNMGRKQEIRDIKESIAKTGCKVLGAVMNNVNLKSFRNRSYYYRSGRYASYYRYDKGYQPSHDGKKK